MAARLYRSSDRIIAGVCAGLAEHLGWNVGLVRAIMVASSFFFGAGIFLYAWFWVLVPVAGESPLGGAGTPSAAADAPSERRLKLFRPAAADGSGGPLPGAAGGGSGTGLGDAFGTGAAFGPGGPLAGRGGRRVALGVRELLAGAALLVAASLLLGNQFGLDLPLGTIIPLAVIGTGAVLAWMQLDETRRAGLLNVAGADKPWGVLRFIAGIALVVVGVLIIVAGSGSWELLAPAMLASLGVLAGVGLVLAPWALKFWRDLQQERAGRIREAERAEIGAHLHDSVLQTLALIQKRAGSPQDVTRLARAQERELREWIYQDAARSPGTLATAVKDVCAELEDLHGTAVEVVAVGDAVLTERSQPLVQATREAVLNAVRHAGTPVSVYLEARADAVEVFIKDRGPGFDTAAIAPDRLGIRESVVGRMARIGGSADIVSSASGTEVRLKLPADRNGPEKTGPEKANTEKANTEGTPQHD
ncbi:ATP-binding protein [Arthrobacter sp. 35W]|uniref:ATP-binding protein n=1 Tax=Arthrobacter sp. 35W TaxID=1132441 RepID=UPI000407A3F4|nr:ATP-binding protein [Arthrobacter sp. 35W]